MRWRLLILVLVLFFLVHAEEKWEREFVPPDAVCRDDVSTSSSPPPTCSHSNFALLEDAGTEGERHCDLIGEHVYFHGIFDFARPSSVPLLVNQVCRALTMCISKDKFRLVLHLLGGKCTSDYEAAADFLRSLGITFTVWTGEFDTKSSQRARLVSLRDLQERDRKTSDWVLQVDADEMPVFHPNSLSSLLQKLQRDDDCDAVYGRLSERVTADGKLANITLGTRLDQQFPLLCNVKERVEQAQSRKLVLYRASYRAGIGNHRLVCEAGGGSEQQGLQKCSAIFSKRADFRQLHPAVGVLPRKCNFGDLLDIEHFKYTWGLQGYLAERIRVFRQNKISWHSESEAVLRHVQMHGGICVSCPDLRCFNETSDRLK